MSSGGNEIGSVMESRSRGRSGGGSDVGLLGHWNAPLAQLAFEVQRAGAHRAAARHRPEHLELEAVGVLGVEREAHTVIGGADQRARRDEPAARADQVGQLAHLPRGVVHAHRALVHAVHARLGEQTEMVVLAAARDAEERGVGIAGLHLEAQHVAVEAHASVHVGDPEHQVLQSLQPDATHAGYSTLTVMAAQAMMVSAPGTLRPPATGRTVTSPWGSSFFTRSTSTLAGSGTPTVTSTSMRPPLARTAVKSGRLECRIASDTARHAALVPSSPCTSTPMPNSSTIACALTLALLVDSMLAFRVSTDHAAAHDPDRIAGDIGRGVGSEEHARLRDLLRPSQPAQRDALELLGTARRGLAELRVPLSIPPLGVDGPRHHHVHADAGGSQLRGERAHQAQQAVLGRGH